MACADKHVIKEHGMLILRNSLTNKGLAFTAEERKQYDITGLLPNQFLTIDQQMHMIVESLAGCPTDLSKYILLMNLFYNNQRLFFYVIMHNLALTMPIIYTPIVGLACQNFGQLSNLMPTGLQGLYISINDQDNILEIFDRWPHKKIDVICVTDGERILGLGDLGAYGMGIPVGKLMLYTACAGVHQTSCLPIHIDVGTNTQKLIDDKFYTGLKQARVTGDKYVEFLDKFMTSVVKKYGEQTLIQFEDFGNHNAFHLINRYRDKYCTFNDDIQGTAAVTVSGLITACRITGIPLTKNTFMFQGAGEAALGIAHLLTLAMQQLGLSLSDARKRIWLVDSKGLIVKNRPAGGMTELKELYAHEHAPVDSLLEAVTSIKPTAIIGVAAIAGAFSDALIKRMGEDQKRPIIFALSNPTSKAECTAEAAYKITEGRCVFASGSPFDDVTINGKTYTPGQGNNAYVFPAIGLAVVACKLATIPDYLFLKTAEILSSLVSDADLASGLVYPRIATIRKISVDIATKLADFIFSQGLAKHSPRPYNTRAFIEQCLYNPSY